MENQKLKKKKIYIDGVNVANCEYLKEVLSGMYFCLCDQNLFCKDWNGCPYKKIQGKKEVIECLKKDIDVLKQQLDKINDDMKLVIRIIEETFDEKND